MSKSLGVLIQKVYDQLNYNPKLNRYRDHVADIINDHYVRVCSEAPWRFLQKTHEQTVYADITGSATSTIAITASRQLVAAGADAISFEPYMEGMVFHGRKGDPNNTADDSFRIAAVKSTSIAYLDKNWPYPTTATQYWGIEFREYLLPLDCSEVLGVMDREDERGRLFSLSRRREEQEFLSRDSTGDPMFWFEHDTLFSRAPDEPPTLSVVNIAGSELKTGRTYEYMYTFYRLGRESNPSPTAKIKLGGGANQVNITDLENTMVLSPSVSAGTYKRLYRRDVTGDGPWQHIASLEDATTTFSDQALVNTALYNSREEVTIHQNTEGRKTIRFWWTPSSTRKLEIRYLQRPVRLQGKTDSSVLPQGYDGILVNLTLSDILSRVGDKTGAQMHAARAEDGMERLRRKELNLPDRVHRFRRIDARSRALSRNFGTPSIT
jgi:hypothetical protein